MVWITQKQQADAKYKILKCSRVKSSDILGTEALALSLAV